MGSKTGGLHSPGSVRKVYPRWLRLLPSNSAIVRENIQTYTIKSARVLIKANTSLKVTDRPISPIRLSNSLGCFHGRLFASYSA